MAINKYVRSLVTCSADPSFNSDAGFYQLTIDLLITGLIGKQFALNSISLLDGTTIKTSNHLKIINTDGNFLTPNYLITQPLLAGKELMFMDNLHPTFGPSFNMYYTVTNDAFGGYIYNRVISLSGAFNVVLDVLVADVEPSIEFPQTQDINITKINGTDLPNAITALPVDMWRFNNDAIPDSGIQVSVQNAEPIDINIKKLAGQLTVPDGLQMRDKTPSVTYSHK